VAVGVDPAGVPSGTSNDEPTNVARVAALDPVRREPTLLLLALAALLAVIGDLTTPGGIDDFFGHVFLFAAFVSGLVAIAALIGAIWARAPVGERRGDPAALAMAAIGLAIATVGLFVQATSFKNVSNGTVGPRSFDIGVILEVGGYAFLAAALTFLAISYRKYQAGPGRKSPVIPIVGSAIGILAYRLPDIYHGSWFLLSVSSSKLVYGLVQGGGLLLIALSLLLSAAWRLGPRQCLTGGGVGVAIVGYAEIHMWYSHSLSGTFFAIGYAVILLALLVWIGTVATQAATPSGLGSLIASLTSASFRRAREPSAQVASSPIGAAPNPMTVPPDPMTVPPMTVPPNAMVVPATSTGSETIGKPGSAWEGRPPTPVASFCSGCGTRRSKGVRYCSSCGQAFEAT
jgi:hypothetical protein